VTPRQGLLQQASPVLRPASLVSMGLVVPLLELRVSQLPERRTNP
jgi:hypothetical protein